MEHYIHATLSISVAQISEEIIPKPYPRKHYFV